MTNIILFDKNYQAVDVLHVTKLSATKNVYNVAEFTADVANYFTADVRDESVISLFSEKECLWSGVIKKRDGISGSVGGYDLKYMLKYHPYFLISGTTPVENVICSGTIGDIFEKVLKAVFPSVIIENDKDNQADLTKKVSINARLKYAFEVLKEICILNDITYEIRAVGNGKITATIRKLVDRSGSVSLISAITHNQIEKCMDTRDRYNQFLALGAGDLENRDYYLIDYSKDAEIKRCYIYDLKQNISHAELVQQATVKFKELSSGYYEKFEIKDNNVAELGRDYFLGDKVNFINRDGGCITDMISEVKITVDGGKILTSYEASVGTGKNSLTQKMNELKTGGYN